MSKIMTKEDLLNKEIEVAPDIWRKTIIVKEREIPSENFDDGSHYAGGKELLFSENNAGWYGYYPCMRIRAVNSN